ncbi:MAG TPA: hypothetical protein VHQ64_20715 [Pyrinomonadaceae bacterium]|jgi:hypothetical protein|nr:hypothetical protein [Pyrinomonadaceae bacterium]
MKRKFALTFAIVLVAAAGALTACHRAASDDETPDNSSYRPLATPATEFEQKLKLMRDAHFQYVWVFTRKDEKEFTSEDRELLHTNAPKVVDWIGMDDKKKFFAGSNFSIDPQNLETLLKRYKIEDYSGK